MVEEKKSELKFYHIGKVIKVIEPKSAKNFDHKKKVVLEMWDNNIITCDVGEANVKDGDYVIVKFNGIVQGNNNIFMNPNQVTDLLSEEAGEQVWRSYKGFFERAKPSHPLTG